MNSHQTKQLTQLLMHQMNSMPPMFPRCGATRGGAITTSFAPRIEFPSGAHGRCSFITPIAAMTSVTPDAPPAKSRFCDNRYSPSFSDILHRAQSAMAQKALLRLPKTADRITPNNLATWKQLGNLRRFGPIALRELGNLQKTRQSRRHRHSTCGFRHFAHCPQSDSSRIH